MEKKILIDAAHPEEVRMAVVRGGQIEEFDIESQKHRHVKGNIYLARVVRIEPSLQAAFIDYGFERHGFLPFPEIHPDYYQIPVADRPPASVEVADSSAGQAVSDPRSVGPSELEDVVAPEAEDQDGETRERDSTDEESSLAASGRAVRPASARSYKIQEVIRRGQILLVQVIKEERGSKGAALTTYISLPGRYCILLPNILTGGGISRKIRGEEERERIRKIIDSLDVPTGMGVVVRTVGESKTKAEIRKDYDYLSRLWEDIRQKVMQATAPDLMYEDGDLVKRTVRDSFDKDVTQILIDGEEAYKHARQVMRVFVPSQVKAVHLYEAKDAPLFQAYGVEEQVEDLFESVVPLPSGGYIVINRTEALTSIDVNSGRSTRERNIEVTALKTNLEAVDGLTRQLRLRDISGLIVIDFIDMEESRHNRAVESRLRECLKSDRAHVQVGRISSFGLLEMSRQRLRAVVTDSLSHVCPRCAGTGAVRSPESMMLRLLRTMGEVCVEKSAGAPGALQGQTLVLRAPTDVLLLLLNQKRSYVDKLEQRYAARWSFKPLVSGAMLGEGGGLGETQGQGGVLSAHTPYRIEAESGQVLWPLPRHNRDKIRGEAAAPLVGSTTGVSPSPHQLSRERGRTDLAADTSESSSSHETASDSDQQRGSLSTRPPSRRRRGRRLPRYKRQDRLSGDGVGCGDGQDGGDCHPSTQRVRQEGELTSAGGAGVRSDPSGCGTSPADVSAPPSLSSVEENDRARGGSNGRGGNGSSRRWLFKSILRGDADNGVREVQGS